MPHLQRAAHIRFQSQDAARDAGRAFRCGRSFGHGGAAAGARWTGEIRQQGRARDGGRRRCVSASPRSVRNTGSKRRCGVSAARCGRDRRAARTSTRRAAASCALRAARARRATLSPLRRSGARHRGLAQEPMALVADRRSRRNAATFRRKCWHQLFGFSAAEMRVAERLMMGDSPEQAAAFLQREDRDRALASGLDLSQDRHQPAGGTGAAMLSLLAMNFSAARQVSSTASPRYSTSFVNIRRPNDTAMRYRRPSVRFPSGS